MKILSYNTRGIGCRIKGRAIQKLLQSEKVDLVCFQETKLANVDSVLCNMLWGNEEIEWVHSPAVNRGGGLLCIWRKGSFVVEEATCYPRWISLKGKWEGMEEACMILNVYAPCILEEKR